MAYSSWKSLNVEEKCLEKWANDMNPNTARNYLYYFLKYLDWCKEQNYFKSAQEMLDDASKLPQEERIKHLDTLIEYVKNKDTGYWDRKNAYAAVRKFYRYHRLDLPKPSDEEKARMLEPSEIDNKRAMDGKTLTTDEVRKIIMNAPQPYKAAIMVCFQAALGRSEFELFNEVGWKNVIDKLDDEEPIQINMVRRKIQKGKLSRYYTFIGKDSKELIKEWLTIREKLIGEWKEEQESIPDVLFLIQNKNERKLKPLSGRMVGERINQTAKRLGLINGTTELKRHHINLHEHRDLFRSLCTTNGVNRTAAEFFMGHVIDKLDYDKSPRYDPDWYRAEYKKVEPKLNVLSNPEGITGYIDEKTQILNFAKSLGVEVTDLKIQKMREQYPDKEEHELIGQIVREELREGEEKQEEDYRQVEENELVNYLKEGWKIVQQLNGSNQYIVKKGG